MKKKDFGLFKPKIGPRKIKHKETFPRQNLAKTLDVSEDKPIAEVCRETLKIDAMTDCKE